VTPLPWRRSGPDLCAGPYRIVRIGAHAYALLIDGSAHSKHPAVLPAANEAERINAARAAHDARDREGHHVPAWEGLPDMMRDEMVRREG